MGLFQLKILKQELTRRRFRQNQLCQSTLRWTNNIQKHSPNHYYFRVFVLLGKFDEEIYKSYPVTRKRKKIRCVKKIEHLMIYDSLKSMYLVGQERGDWLYGDLANEFNQRDPFWTWLIMSGSVFVQNLVFILYCLRTKQKKKDTFFYAILGNLQFVRFKDSVQWGRKKLYYMYVCM